MTLTQEIQSESTTISYKEQMNIWLKRIIRLRHEMWWVLIGQCLAFLGGFVGIKLLTKTMGPAVYGELALGLTIAGVVNMFIYGPLAQAVARYYSIYRERNSLGIYLFVLKRTHIFLAGILLALTVIVTVVVDHLAGRQWGLIVLSAALFAIISGIHTSLLSLQGAIRRRKIVALHQGADTWFRPLLALGLIAIFRNTGYFALLGFCLGTLFVTISEAYFTVRDPIIHPQWENGNYKFSENDSNQALRELFIFGGSFTVFAGFASINMYADRWILQGLFREKEVGIYVALYQIANAPIAFLAGVISQFIVPIIYERAGNISSLTQVHRSSRLLNQTVLLASLSMAAVLLVAYEFSGFIVQLLTTSEFAQGHQILWVLVLGLSLFQIAQLITTKGLYHNIPKIYFYPKMFYAVSFLVFAYLGTIQFGMRGMAWSWVTSSFLYLIFVIYANKKCSPAIEKA
jgi:O-antigen/teichoic acid export membrane protein